MAAARLQEFNMDYEIKDKKDGIDINISGVKGKKEKLLEAFQDCSEGICSCQTDEYKKLKSLEIEQSEDGIQLHLNARDGEKLDISEINKCLIETSEKIK